MSHLLCTVVVSTSARGPPTFSSSPSAVLFSSTIFRTSFLNISVVFIGMCREHEYSVRMTMISSRCWDVTFFVTFYSMDTFFLNDLALTNLLPFSHSCQSLVSESCSCITTTFCGLFFHWDLVTDTTQGIRSLVGIIHLTLWITDCMIPIPYGYLLGWMPYHFIF